MSTSLMAVALAVAVLQTTPAGQSAPSQLPEIVVEGRVREEAARAFIDEVAAPPRGATVARWNGELCVGAIGLRAGTAQFLIDRVSGVAEDLGVETGEPGCDPNVVIAASTDGAAMARALVERRRNVLAPGNSIQSRSRADLEAFVETDRPVRWWHVSTAVDPVTGRSAVRNAREDNFDSSSVSAIIENVGRSVQPLLIRSTVRQDLRRAVIIIDFDEIGDDVDFNQLADYVAFVALAQADPEADTSGFPTVLNLFDDPTTPGLTEWDRAYLRGLYNSDDTARGRNAREAALRREMLRARGDEPQPDGD